MTKKSARHIEVETLLERERREVADDGTMRSLVSSLCDDGGRDKYANLLNEIREFAPDLLGARDGELRLFISADAMTVEIEILPPLCGGRSISADDVLEQLLARGVVYGVLPEAVDRGVRNGLTSRCKEIVARGTPAVSGQTRTIRTVEVKDTRLFAENDFGAVDLRSCSRIRTVEEGEVVAEIIPARPGADGRNCLGAAIPAEELRIFTMALGEGVVERDGAVVAALAGEFRTERKTLTVLPVLVVNSDVDYGTGNIIFPGNVYIKGNVLDKFSVHCAGTLRIGGNVFGANLDAAGDIEIQGGIAGRDSGLVRAGGTITVKYIESATVEAAGDITVSKAIIHSNVSSNGSVRLTARPGVIMGGEIHASRGLQCASLGCVSFTRTRVRVGENFLHARKKIRLRESVEFLKTELFSLDSQRARLITNGSDESKVEPLDRRMAKVREGLRCLLAREVQLAREDSEIIADWTIEVRDRTYPGVCFYYRNYGKTFDIESSAASFRFDASTQSFAVGALTL